MSIARSSSALFGRSALPLVGFVVASGVSLLLWGALGAFWWFTLRP
jgi:hypothetical protein